MLVFNKSVKVRIPAKSGQRSDASEAIIPMDAGP
jgi:hypothetical protein